jgi:hypothetical protein
MTIACQVASPPENVNVATAVERELLVGGHVRRFRWLLIAMGFVWILCEIAAVAGASTSPFLLAVGIIFRNPFLALNGTCCLYFLSRPSWREVTATAVLSASLFALLLVVGAGPIGPSVVGNTLCQGVGLTCLGMLVLRVRTESGRDRMEARAILYPALLQFGLLSLALFFLFLSIQICSVTHDLRVYAADDALGIQPSFLVGRLFVAAPPLALVCGTVYHLLPAASSFVYAMQWRAPRPAAVDVFTTSLCVALVGFPLYLLFPVVGPVFSFDTAFPYFPPPLDKLLPGALHVPDQPRNCMPSLHTAWALVVWWHTRGLPGWVRALSALFLGLTLLATLGLGLHYAFDLVVGVPFAVTVQATCVPHPEGSLSSRAWVVGLGAGLTGLWLLVLRYGGSLLVISRGSTWAAVLLTVLGSLWIERTLYSVPKPRSTEVAT